MPIVYVHGAGQRSTDPNYTSKWEMIRLMLARFVAPAIANDPENVLIERAVWGDLAAPLAWGGISRPRTALLQLGATDLDPSQPEKLSVVVEYPQSLMDLPADARAPATPSTLLPAGPGGGGNAAGQPGPVSLSELTPNELSDLAAKIVARLDNGQEEEKACLILAADKVAHDPAARGRIASKRGQEVEEFRRLVAEEYASEQAQATGLDAMGPLDLVAGLGERLNDALSEAQTLPGYVASKVALEGRPKLMVMATHLLGDPFFYLKARGDASNPGPIPQRILEYLVQAWRNKKQRNGEPLVVLSHSQGGQIMYDVVSHFLPKINEYKDIKIDFWVPAASQVGLFEEMKLFLASSDLYSRVKGNMVPFPASNLSYWWNVWDPNDVVSFTVKDIFAEVDDWAFDSHMSALDAHGGYIQLPSFFRAFGERVRSAKSKNWSRT